MKNVLAHFDCFRTSGSRLIIILALIFSVSGLVLPAELSASDSRKSASFSLMFSPYRPDEVEAGQSGLKWRDLYGNDREIYFGLDWEREMIQKYGILALGGGMGYIQADGKSLYNAGGTGYEVSGESMRFDIVPVSANLTYRLVYFQNQILVPYIRGGMDMYFFREEKEGDETIAGYRSGYHYAFGGALLLDYFSPGSAVNLDLEWGINNTYLIFEYRYSFINDFQEAHDFDFSAETWFGGILFEY